ncbi:putative ABC transporter peptide-binding protein YtcQ [Paenibacillus sp. J31TS4]|uniref:extracellular solute-binding protein n=1 Tax=Paenibacillus sp. J31TS4 TaxID=2807195 RepID=UPI001B1E566D|nr:extracellular solute-binding protein [Paenibacillus sp. J31TS4]GIP40612.1 putative ABC transporter peptide-binding protein YtcQ [Paenibacillus sp. J31TS4]
MWKKNGALLMTAALSVTAIAGCGSSSKEAQGSGGAQTPAGPTKITIMANLHTAEVPSDLIEKKVEEATNTQLEINWVPDGSYEEKMNASLATGTLPQVVYLKNQSSLILFKDAIRNNQFWEIGPLLKDYPNLKNLNQTILNNTAVDGKYYALYQETPLSRQGVIYRKDWADALGIEPPKTTEDLYKMMKAFTENDPDKNGKKDTIGLTDRNDLIYGAFKTLASYFGTPNSWGEKDGKLAPDFTFPNYVETMKYVQRLHKEGIINQDFPVTSKTDQQNLFITGKAGVYIGSMADVISLWQKINPVNKNAKLDVVNRITGPQGTTGIWSIPGYGTAMLFPKSAVKTEKDLRAILTFYDKLMSPELTNLIYFGVEGTHYKLQDGKAAVVDDIKLTDRDVKPYQVLMVGGQSTNGMLKPYFSYDTKAKAEELILDNNKVLINDPTAPLDSKTYTEKGVRLQDIIKDATYNFIIGKIDEAGFQKEVDRWKKEGGDKIIEEYNAAYTKAKSEAKK